jgi:hypothetical protein
VLYVPASLPTIWGKLLIAMHSDPQVFTDVNGNANACHDINTGLRFYLPLSTPARNCATDSAPVIISPLSTLLVS